MKNTYKVISIGLYLVGISMSTIAQQDRQHNPRKTNISQVSGANSKLSPVYQAPASVTFTDDFNSANYTNALKSRGYIPYYRGTGPQSNISPLWFTGQTNYFNAFNGPDTGYVGADYEIVINANDIDSWLVLPALSALAGDTLSFYARSPSQDTAFSYYRDSIKVMYSAAGDSVPEDLTWVQLGNFQTDTVNWVRYTFTAPAAGANARFAIRYAVVNGGPLGNNSYYIGIDQLDVIPASGIGISKNNPPIQHLSIAPNPAIDNFTIRISGLQSKNARLEIIDMLGKTCLEKKLDAFEGTTVAKINVDKWNRGIYLVRIIDADNMLSGKVIIR